MIKLEENKVLLGIAGGRRSIFGLHLSSFGCLVVPVQAIREDIRPVSLLSLHVRGLYAIFASGSQA